MDNLLNLPHGLSIRPSTPADKAFIEGLFRSTREDLQNIDAEPDLIESVMEMQLDAQTTGHGDMFPNAMYFIIEKLGEPIGRLTIDFGSNEIRVVNIAFISETRGRGYGEGVFRALQVAAESTAAPLVVIAHMQNPGMKSLYLKLGFQVDEIQPPFERMVWYPASTKIIV